MPRTMNDIFQESADVSQRSFHENARRVEEAAALLTSALRAGKKVLIFGNGGSACDSQHMAAELVGRFQKERAGLPAVALTADTAVLTSVGNDYGFDMIFRRQIEALGQTGDAAVGISTSGNSPNVVAGMEAARRKGESAFGYKLLSEEKQNAPGSGVHINPRKSLVLTFEPGDFVIVAAEN